MKFMNRNLRFIGAKIFAKRKRFPRLSSREVSLVILRGRTRSKYRAILCAQKFYAAPRWRRHEASIKLPITARSFRAKPRTPMKSAWACESSFFLHPLRGNPWTLEKPCASQAKGRELLTIARRDHAAREFCREISFASFFRESSLPLFPAEVLMEWNIDLA